MTRTDAGFSRPQMGAASRGAGRDAAVALAVAAASFALYITTLLPDFGGPEDTPKFQFVGYVLGTPHPPGYPLYVMLSHLFVQLPIGTIAYRANLFSAVLAALACALTYAIARQIGAPRWAAVAGALGLATGASYWRSAVFAEVYSLAAVMTGLTVSLLLAWGARGTARRLLLGVAAFALGLGNHLMSVGLVPACALYVLLKDRRAVTVRVAALTALIMAAGAAQYGFVILRSRQGAPYLESRAHSIQDLIGVVTAERFAGQRFAFSASQLITIQAPVVASVIRAELTPADVAMLIAGLVAAIRRRSSGAALLAGGAAGLLGMVLNLSGDMKGFITPVMVLLWPLAALGAAAIVDLLRSLSVPRPVAAAIGIAAAAAIPIVNVAANYKEADQSVLESPAPFLRGMFAQLPDRAAVVAEDYWFDMALHYMMLTGEAGPRRGIGRAGFDAADVREAARDGRRVFAFAGAATFLASEGLRFERTAIQGPALHEWLRSLPRGTILVGSTAYAAVPFDLGLLGHPGARPGGRSKLFEAFALIADDRGSAWRSADDPVSLTVDGSSLNARLPPSLGPVVASADSRGARVTLGGRTLAAAGRGLVLAAFTPGGSLNRALELPASAPLAVPYQGAVYELTGETSCAGITTGAWTDLGDVVAAGSWTTSFPDAGQLVIEYELPPAVGVGADELLGGGHTRVTSQRSAGAAVVTSIELTRTGGRRPLFRVALDRVPVRARARLADGSIRARLTVCSFRPSRPLFERNALAGALRPDFEAEAYFGAGWSGAQRASGQPIRYAHRRATLLLPLERTYRYRVAFELDGPPGRVDFAIGDTRLGACELRGPGPCELTLEPGILQDDVTALTITSSHDVGFHGARIVRETVRPPSS